MDKIKIDLGFATLVAKKGIDVKVYADCDNEDFTDEFGINIYEEED